MMLDRWVPWLLWWEGRRAVCSSRKRLIAGSFRNVTLGPDSDEPVGEEVPIADAVEQRLPVGETRELSEVFQPTEASAIASEAPAPADVNAGDWQERLTSADTGEDWDESV